MEREIYYKSLGEDPNSGSLGTCTFDPRTKTRIACQTLKEILESQSIVPNTAHSTFPRRLCVSRLDEDYNRVYRPQGMVFETSEKPAVYIPFDLMALTNGKNLDSTDYYSKTLLGYERFLFRNYEEMIRKFKDPKQAIVELNEFRKEHSLPEIPSSKLRYNEICFIGNEPVKVSPLALIGEGKEVANLAEKYNVKLYANINSYLNNERR